MNRGVRATDLSGASQPGHQYRGCGSNMAEEMSPDDMMLGGQIAHRAFAVLGEIPCGLSLGIYVGGTEDHAESMIAIGGAAIDPRVVAIIAKNMLQEYCRDKGLDLFELALLEAGGDPEHLIAASSMVIDAAKLRKESGDD